MIPTTLHAGAGLLPACGWSLLNFLWQGTIFAGALAAALKISRRDSASLRYVICCAALGGMALSPVLTCASLKLRPIDRPPFQRLGSATAGSVPAGSGPIERGEHFLAQHSFGNLINWTDHHMAGIVIVWSLGMLFTLARVLLSVAAAERLKAARLCVAPDNLQSSASQLASRLKLSHPPRLAVSGQVSAPVVIGWRKPAVLLPDSFLSGLSLQQAEAILAHELAHVWRRDYLLNLLQAIVEAVLFYHPAVWWASRQIRREREHCCDDLAMRMTGSALAYAKALTALEERRFPAMFEPSLGAYGGDLSMRIKRLLEGERRERYVTATRLSLASLGGITAVTLVLFSISATNRVSAQTVQTTTQLQSQPVSAVNEQESPVSISATNGVGAPPVQAITQQQPQPGSAANEQKTPDMSCTYYDSVMKDGIRQLREHDGVCEASTQEEDLYLCRQTDGTELAQQQSGCEWKVKRFREWQLRQSQNN